MVARSSFAVFALLLACLTLQSSAEDSTDALSRERQEQTGTAITILFDNSGSMRGEKLSQAKSAFKSWLQTVPEDYKFSLITFENNATLQVPLGANTRALVAKKVAETAAISNTPICKALRIAREQIEKRRHDVTPYERHVVLIFTDGEENVDPRGIKGVCADITEMRRRMIEVVGIGFHGEGDYMDGVASRFVLANNEQELKQGLRKVDAEIGGVDDLVVSPADLAALKTFKPSSAPVASIPEPAHPEAAAPSAVASSPDTTTVVSPHSGGISTRWIIYLVIVFFIVRRFASRSAR